MLLVLHDLQFALVAGGGFYELGQRSGLLRIFLFLELALLNSSLGLAVQVLFEVRAPWLVLFGLLLQLLLMSSSSGSSRNGSKSPKSAAWG